jgi:hypothetical protein
VIVAHAVLQGVDIAQLLGFVGLLNIIFLDWPTFRKLALAERRDGDGAAEEDFRRACVRDAQIQACCQISLRQ